ncbi:MAG: TetR/AcrR family transcriptional regulator [Sneathiellales bacterium]|nr:TetR/AcrR family transcriptional regulator [Sneathiellales bacterium]
MLDSLTAFVLNQKNAIEIGFMSERRQENYVAERPVYQERSREKRDRLVKAGFQIFSRDGYEGARIADIAKEAGISVGSFYHRFGDKRGFFQILLEEYTHRGMANWQIFFAHADRNWPAAELFERLIRGNARAVERNMGLFNAYLILGRTDLTIVEPFRKMDQTGARLLLKHLKDCEYPGSEDLEFRTVHIALSSIGKSLAFSAAVKGSTFRATDPFAVKELAVMLQRYLSIE